LVLKVTFIDTLVRTCEKYNSSKFIIFYFKYRYVELNIMFPLNSTFKYNIKRFEQHFQVITLAKYDYEQKIDIEMIKLKYWFVKHLTEILLWNEFDDLFEEKIAL